MAIFFSLNQKSSETSYSGGKKYVELKKSSDWWEKKYVVLKETHDWGKNVC